MAASREVLDFLRGHKLIGGLVNKLKIALLAVNVLVEDAKEKQATKPNVRTWLHELKDAVYDAEDILDKVASQALRCKLDAQFETTAIKVRNRTYASLSLYKLRGKIEEVHDRLKSLADQKDVIGLREGVTGRPSERSPTTSLVEESDLFGRDDEKEEIIKGLLSEDKSGNEVGAIAIAGMGGMGKTTLAQQVYNDERVKKQFDIEAWVCSSEDFDLFKVTKTMLDEVTGSTTDIGNLDQLQVKLWEKLTGKFFLLILDDVWNKNLDEWEALSKPWKSGARGSKVIITSRDQSVASVTNASTNLHLEKLTEDDCWSLFAKYAFGNTNSSARPELEEVGRQIANKCEGLPLAAKAIGAMLRTKANVDEWERILNSELWNLSIEETKILPALIMAEGFLQDVGTKTTEEVDEDYFYDFVSRLLFQRSVDHDTHFVMHDLINDLAKFVSGQFSFRLNVDKSHEGFPKTRYLSKHWGSGSGLGELGKLTNLRGALSISELQNVESPRDTLDANLKNKNLPPLGQLHSLQNLSIEGFDGNVTVSSEFYGTGSSSIKRFGSLKVLTFMQMSNWETWFPFGAENEDLAFPSLEELYIQKCPKLKVGFFIYLPSLAKLEIYECPQLVISLRKAPVIREYKLMRCNEVLLKELPVGMQRLRVGGFDSVESLPEGLLDSNSCLQELEIKNCSSLVSLPTKGLSTTFLEKLVLSHCHSLGLFH
ncbi:putative disease resistance RPP13-like protein 1 [Morella rubra]|uniref:Putative disease resistance RPP13-like protein 1 n=1 Tax=Morella rubra TaxID=262757 RepID=A0A6A1WSH2_9ROSI|nr:putative disease resistance RPP13-like protein 1 [Morella rubra]